MKNRLPLSGNRTDRYQQLRRRAYEMLEQPGSELPDLTTCDLKTLIEEIHVYQIEMELQNEELQDNRNRLETSHQYLSDLFTYSPVSYLVMTREGIIEKANEAALQYFGLSNDILTGKRFPSFLSYESYMTFRQFTADLEKAGGSLGAEIELRVKKGEPLWARMDLFLLLPPEEEERRLLCSLLDISEQRRASEKLLKFNTELELRSLELERQIAEREEAEKAFREKQAQLVHASRLSSLGEMATGVAHELNQPLSIISVQAQILKKTDCRNESDRLNQALDVILNQIDRASEIINSMRGYVRRDEAIRDDIDLSVLVGEGLIFFREQFKHHRILLETDFAPDLPQICINVQQFEQIVVNFLSNARYALDQREASAPDNFRKKILIRLFYQRESEQIFFEVTDNGIGMTPEEKDRCLEPFFTTKEVGEGTGLGLSIVHSIVRELNGKLEMESRRNEGTTFRVILPAGDRNGGRPCGNHSRSDR